MCKDSREIVERQLAIEARIALVEADIRQIRHDTSDMIEMFRALSGGFKVLTWLGKLARPIGYMAACVAAIAGAWATLRAGVGR